MCYFLLTAAARGADGAVYQQLWHQLYTVPLTGSQQLQVSYPNNYRHKNISQRTLYSGSATELILLRAQHTNQNKYLFLRTEIKALT